MIQKFECKQKRLFLLFAAILINLVNLFAQDVITLKNGNDTIGLVYEIGDTVVKYKKIENPNGPNYILKKSEIFMIRYANGSKDIFTDISSTIPQPLDQSSVLDRTHNPTPQALDYSVKKNKSSLTFLKGQEKLNVVFDYSALIVQGFSEKNFLENKEKKWIDQWEEAKAYLYYDRFLWHLNKNVNAKKTRLISGDYPESQYQATIRVLKLGKNWEMECEVYFTKTGDPIPLAKINIKGDVKTIGIGNTLGINAPFYLIRTAFGYAGQNLGEFMAKKIK